MRNGKNTARAVTIAVTSPVLLWLSGVLAQLIINVRAWQAAGGDMRVSPGLPALKPGACLAALLKFPEGPVALGAVLGGVALLILLRLHPEWKRVGREADRNLTISGSGSYGTSAFMSAKEAKACFDITTVDRTERDILGMLPNGKVVTLPERSRLNANIAVCGASGTGKSRSVSRNLILQAARRGDSVIVTDPKSELYESMSEYLRGEGYVVRVFNLVEMVHSDSWNCLGEVGTSELMAQTFSDVVLSNTGGETKDAFWHSAELNLLKALVLYVAFEMPPEKRNLAQVYDLLCGTREKDLTSEMLRVGREHFNAFTGERLKPCPAAAPYSLFMQASETVRSSVIIGLGSKLQVMSSPEVRNITSHDEIDLELPGKRKCAYFCIVSDQDGTFEFLSSLFFSFLFIKLIRYADNCRPDGVLEPRVRFILDEFPNCCLIPDFTKKCSTIRSRGCSVAVFFQNIGQMKNRYPDDQWQEILGACDSTIFLGCTDVLTAEYFSNRIGDTTVETEGTSRELSTVRLSDYTPQYRRTRSVARRLLMTPEEILRMDPDDELVFIRGQRVFRAKRFDYSRHCEYPKLIRSKAVSHEPEWRKQAIQTPAVPQEIPAVREPVRPDPDTPEDAAPAPRTLGRRREYTDIFRKH